MSSNFDFFNFSRDIDFFNSSLTCSDSEIRRFNEVASFLRNLEHCQKLYRYRRTKLFEYMFWILNDLVWKWFKKRSHFNSLSRFDMILTKAFLSQKQRKLKSITQKRTKRKVRKIAKRAELNDIKTTKQTSTFQDLDIFDSSLTFDKIEFDLYSNVATFLQHFEQCQHLYRKSNLLNLLSKCLCDYAFDWFKTQFEFISLKRFSKILTKTFSKASVRRISKNSNFQLSTLDVISKSIEISSDSEITNARITCKLCKQNFNFNKKLYQHIRNHETLKLVNDFHLSINAVNLICEIKKTSLVSHKSFASSAIQKSINQFAIAFETIILLKRSILQSFALETASKSTKRLSTCRHCKQTFNFKEMFRQHKREQHAKKFVVNSHFSIDAVKSTRESMKISTINFTLSLLASLDIFNSTRSHQNLERKRFNQIVIFIQHLQKCQHLYCESKLLDWLKVILYDFVDIWFKNQSNFIFLHDFDIALTKTFSTSIFNTMFVSSLSISTTKSTYETKKKSIVMNSLVSSELQTSTATSKQKFEFAMIFETVISSKESHFSSIASEIVSKSMKNKSTQWSTFLSRSKSSSRTFESEFQKISVQKTFDICSFLSNNTVNSTSEVARKSIITCSLSSQKSSTSFATSKNLITNTITSLQFVSSNCSNLSIATSKITSKCMKNTSISFTKFAEVAKIIKNSLAKIRTQIARIRVKLEIERAIFQLSTLESASKSMKKFSIQQIVCARICKRCKQNFNFNNKFHEHIREHHARKSVQNLNFRIFASEFTCKIKKKSAFICSFVSFVSQKSFIFFATSRNQIFSTKIISQFLSSKCSNFSIATYKINSKSMKNAIVDCSFIFSSISSLDSIRKHQKFHIQKFYLIVNDLNRMFVENSKSFDLRQHHNRRLFSQNFDFRQFDRSCSTSSKKSHFIIENLFEMFDEKFEKKNLFQSQNNVFF